MTEAEEFTPLGDRLLLKRMETNLIKGGIIIPETHEGKQLRYIVISKAPHITDIQVGDEVLAVPDGGQKISINGEGTCEVIEKRRIMGVIQYD